MPNRLAQSQSLYLRQHADNPVDWYAWGEEALAAARQRDCPLLVSIGYSSCHWCHVMAHESFEDPYIAKLMNTHFVCIKVDREERPDIDSTYMEAVQMMHGHGGWPLNVFCFPDGRPFIGGTYFPPEDRGNGMVPWPQLLTRVSDYFQNRRDELEENASAILQNLEAANQAPQASEVWSPVQLIDAARSFASQHDDTYGGFGQAPKFPPAMRLAFLQSVRTSRAVEEHDAALARRIDFILRRSFDALARGGLFDQIGGGFSRYCVDAAWRIPHFEKMLYDNALLLRVFSRQARAYGRPWDAAVAIETVAWLEREMRAPSGAYFAALDADSEGVEGATYTWTPKEVAAVLGEESAPGFCEAYGITTEGNFEAGRSHPYAAFEDFTVRREWADARHALLQTRLTRRQPGRDEKLSVSWNALLIPSLTEAALAFDASDWFVRAADLGEWLWSVAGDGQGKLAATVYGDTRGEVPGFLDAYAFAAEAFLSLVAYAPLFGDDQGAEYLARAESLAESIEAGFADPAAPGYFFALDGADGVGPRRKLWPDQATPGGNSTLLGVFASLHALTGKRVYAERLARLRQAFAGWIAHVPEAVPQALDLLTQEALGICVLKRGKLENPDSESAALRRALASRPWRRLFVVVDGSESFSGWQLCVGNECHPPLQDTEAVAALI